MTLRALLTAGSHYFYRQGVIISVSGKSLFPLQGSHYFQKQGVIISVSRKSLFLFEGSHYFG
jgi:hypothetical protein